MAGHVLCWHSSPWRIPFPCLHPVEGRQAWLLQRILHQGRYVGNQFFPLSTYSSKSFCDLIFRPLHFAVCTTPVLMSWLSARSVLYWAEQSATGVTLRDLCQIGLDRILTELRHGISPQVTWCAWNSFSCFGEEICAGSMGSFCIVSFASALRRGSWSWSPCRASEEPRCV